MSRQLIAHLVLVAMPVLIGCSSEPPRFYCGAGLRDPAQQLVDEFGKKHGVKIVCDFAGSEVLLTKIKVSRRGDLYMPGDVHYIEMAQREDLIRAYETACYFVPVIQVQKGNPKRIQSLEDLKRPDLRIGVGEAEVCAIGRKTMKILEKNQISPDELNVVYTSVTVNELGNHVKLGHLDAAIVWDGVAALTPEATEAIAIPYEQNIISTVAIGTLKSTRHADLGRQFVQFATSDRGREIFKEHGFTIQRPAER